MPDQLENQRNAIQILTAEIVKLREKVEGPNSGLLERVEILENQQGAPQLPSLAGPGPPYETPAVVTDFIDESDEQEPVVEDLLPFEIEFGKPTADVTADGYTVTLQPCDADGDSFASADTVTVFVPPDGESIELGLFGWTTASILSFIRFAPWLDDGANPDIAGVLIGLGGLVTPTGILFSARLVQEAAGGLGEYDAWKEVIVDSNGVWKDRNDGDQHTEETTSMSLWESNDTEGIYAASSDGVVVAVRLEVGDNDQYSFVYERMRGDNEVAGTKTAGADDATWIQIENDGRIVRGKHCTPGPCCYSIGTNCSTDCSFDFNYFELDEVGHVRIIAGHDISAEPVWEDTGPNA